MLCNFVAMSSMVKTLGVFRTESLLVQRERAAQLYSVASFYSAKVVAEVWRARYRGGVQGWGAGVSR